MKKPASKEMLAFGDAVLRATKDGPLSDKDAETLGEQLDRLMADDAAPPVHKDSLMLSHIEAGLRGDHRKLPMYQVGAGYSTEGDGGYYPTLREAIRAAMKGQKHGEADK